MAKRMYQCNESNTEQQQIVFHIPGKDARNKGTPENLEESSGVLLPNIFKLCQSYPCGHKVPIIVGESYF